MNPFVFFARDFFSNRAGKMAVAIFSVLLLAGTAQATLFWEADTNRGLAVFAGLNIAPGTITVAPDPLAQYGNVYKFFLPDTNSAFGKERCESSGTSTSSGEFRVSYNTDYYIGWRAMWSPMPINPGWVALFQMHGYGVTGQGAPLVLRCVNGDGNLYMQNNANGVDTNFWHTPFKTNVWQTFVVHVFLSTNYSQGYTEIWYNGVLQTNNAGTTRWYGPTWDNVDGIWSDSYNKLKWGCYRSGAMDGKGYATAYMSEAKVGSTYADVDPNGNSDFTIAGTPSVLTTKPDSITNYTVTISPVGGFGGVVGLSYSGMPSGTITTFNPTSITNSGTSKLTVITSGSTPVGSYPVSLIGTSGSLTHTNVVTLVVSGFDFSATPQSQAVNVGSNATFTVNVTTNSSFTGNVNLGISGLPSDVSAGFVPPTLNQSGSSTLTITTTTNSAGGNYLLTIFGTNGSFVATTTATLTLNALQANAGVLIWTNGAINSNWSGIFNWTNVTVGGYGPPGISNSVVFTNYSTTTASALTAPGSGMVVPANINSSVNGSFSIISLTNFANAVYTSPVYHNLGLASGTTLTVAGNVQIGDGTGFDFGGNNVVNMTISGAGATFQANSNFYVNETSGSSGPHNAMLDLSGLDDFAMNGGQIRVGVEGSNPAHYATGLFYFAKTNNLTLTLDGTGALYIGHNKSAAPTIPPALYLGISNAIYFFNNTGIIVGRANTPGSLLAFNPAFIAQNPTVYFRGADDNSRVATWSVGDNSANANNSANATSGINDFTGGTIDALVGTLELGVSCPSGGSASGNGTGTFAFNSGTLDVNILQLGVDTGNSGTSAGIGVMNVNGGLLTVNSNLQLGVFVAGSGGLPQGTLNVNGGTVEATNITGGGVSVINLNRGTMDLQPDWAATQGVLSNITTLNIGGGGNSSAALITDAALIASPNTLMIASNGIISGNTIISTPTLIVNGSISPGDDGAGAITNSGSTTLGAGGHYAVTIDDATAGPVSGWSFLQSGGGINVQSTTVNPFTIDVGTADNPADDFDSNGNYDWVIATGGSIANFATNKFVINSSQFQNDLGGGYFYIHASGNSLILSFTNPPTLPVAINISSSGNNFIFSGSNGNVGAQYHVLASTNLALPLSNWTVIATNNFDGNGNFLYTNPADPNAPSTFYLLQLQ